jgi:hypothetical protein
MKEHPEELGPPRPLAESSTVELVGQMVRQSTELVKKQVELAKAEVKADVSRELAAAKKLGVAGICGVTGLNLLLVALVFGLAQVMAGWAAALLVAGVVLAIGGIVFAIGWNKRVKRPLDSTQKLLKEDIRWTKQQIA